ncbi:MAG: peptide chain release factor N(5)-glutamine methyltransferase [Pseudomonadota bacterium]|nr:peptide chain release factor N(5)-glutamine methyltransferase [Pseudomonadota bacterium]
MKLKELVKIHTDRLHSLKVESARLDVELIVANCLELNRTDLMLQENQTISNSGLKEIEKDLERRAAGEPVAYILGHKDFYKETFIVNSGVLVPRPETELIVEEALSWIGNKSTLKILDLGCGSGCIGLSIIKETLGNQMCGIDASISAVQISLINAKKLKVDSRCKFIHTNVLSLKVDSVNLVVANPPYLDESDTSIDRKSLNFEPKEALYSKEQGFFDVKEWLKKSAELLLPSGLLLMEIGVNQGDLVREFLTSNHLFSEFKILKDLSDRERVIRAIK